MKQRYNYGELFNFLKNKVGHDCARIILYKVYNYDLHQYLYRKEIRGYDFNFLKYKVSIYVERISKIISHNHCISCIDSDFRCDGCDGYDYSDFRCEGCDYLDRKKDFFHRIRNFIVDNQLRHTYVLIYNTNKQYKILQRCHDNFNQ
jgi:hypothetical protein